MFCVSFVCVFVTALILFRTVVFQYLSKSTNRDGWLDDRRGPSQILCDPVTFCVYIDQLFCHCFHLIWFPLTTGYPFAWWLFILFMFISWVIIYYYGLCQGNSNGGPRSESGPLDGDWRTSSASQRFIYCFQKTVFCIAKVIFG